MNIDIYTDGGSRGNPGISGGGVVAQFGDTPLFQKGFFFGQKTNNEAEYLAFLEALSWLETFTQTQVVEVVHFFLDSKLVVEQIQKHWKIKEPRLMELAQQAWKKMDALPCSFTVTHVLRHKNAVADSLANEAMDRLS